MLASQPQSAMPDQLAAQISDAIADESARRQSAMEPQAAPAKAAARAQPAGDSVPSLPAPRSAKPWPSWDVLVPLQREASSHA
jgi:hypothetical protein